MLEYRAGGLRIKCGEERGLRRLIAIHHPQIAGPGQIGTALAHALGEPVLVIARGIGPRQVRPRRPGCLPFFRLGPPPRSAFSGGGAFPRSSSLDGGDDEFLLLRDSKCSS
ncbi:MAG TPA: hypothetical protein VGJ44_12685, partial [Kribbellaceae bacterium]